VELENKLPEHYLSARKWQQVFVDKSSSYSVLGRQPGEDDE